MGLGLAARATSYAAVAEGNRLIEGAQISSTRSALILLVNKLDVGGSGMVRRNRGRPFSE